MPITIAGADYNVVFGTDPTNGAPRLYLIDSSDAVTYGTLDCCGEDYAIFAFGGATLCPGDRDCPPTPPSRNVFRLKVAWAECSAWYCAALASEGSGSGGDNCEPMYLTESEVCSDEFVICDGPFASYAEALSECLPASVDDPPGDPEYTLSCFESFPELTIGSLPDRVKITITSDCPAFTGPVVTYGVHGESGLWDFSASGTGWSVAGTLFCNFSWTDPDPPACGAIYCNGPVYFDGAATCPPAFVAFQCCTYFNQTGSGDIDPVVDCYVVLGAGGTTFTLHIEDYGSGPP